MIVLFGADGPELPDEVRADGTCVGSDVPVTEFDGVEVDGLEVDGFGLDVLGFAASATVKEAAVSF